VLYLYHKEAGASILALTGDDHRYIFKVRRHKVNDRLHLRNLNDAYLYTYEIEAIDKRTVHLSLLSKEQYCITSHHSLHIGWCIIDPKNIEKILPSLNEMGVEKITFIYCQRSQKSFKPDFKRLEKILLNSSQQSGRSVMMKLELMDNLQVFLEKYPESYVLNFSENTIEEQEEIKTIVIGCEGGFHEEELDLVDPSHIVGFDTPLVLKSESAVCAVTAKLLL